MAGIMVARLAGSSPAMLQAAVQRGGGRGGGGVDVDPRQHPGAAHHR